MKSINYLFIVLLINMSACAQKSKSQTFNVKFSIDKSLLNKAFIKEDFFKGQYLYLQKFSASAHEDDSVIDSCLINDKGESNINFNANEGNLYYLAIKMKIVGKYKITKLIPFINDQPSIHITYPDTMGGAFSPANNSLYKLMSLTSSWNPKDKKDEAIHLTKSLNNTASPGIALYASEELLKYNPNRYTTEKIIRTLNEKFPRHDQVKKFINVIQEYYPQYITGKDFEIKGTVNPEGLTGKVYLKTDQSKYDYSEVENYVLLDSGTVNNKGEFHFTFKSLEDRIYQLDFERQLPQSYMYEYNPNKIIREKYVRIGDELPKKEVIEKRNTEGSFTISSKSESQEKPELKIFHEIYTFINDQNKINMDIIAGKKIESNSPATNLYNTIEKYAYKNINYSFDPYVTLKIHDQPEFKTAPEKRIHIDKYFTEYKKTMFDYLKNTTNAGIALFTAKQLLTGEFFFRNIKSYNKDEITENIIKILSQKFPNHTQVSHFLAGLKASQDFKTVTEKSK